MQCIINKFYLQCLVKMASIGTVHVLTYSYYVSVWMYTCRYVYMYVCVCVYVVCMYVCTCMYIYMYLCMYVCMYVCMCVKGIV